MGPKDWDKRSDLDKGRKSTTSRPRSIATTAARNSEVNKYVTLSPVVLLLGSGVKRHVGKKACLFKSRGVKRHVVKSQSVNWHAVFRQSMKKGMFPLGLTRVQPQCKLHDSTQKY